MAFGTLRTTGLASGISIFAVSAALAQDDFFTLDPITIYGDRTTTQADESNASVAIIGGERLDNDPSLTTYRDVFRRMGNVQAGDWTESGFVIRGINSEGQTPGGLGAPLASFYIDGIQQTVEGTRRGQRGLFDAEQVEVYRGPQSTLSGRAASAGAMYIRTKDPEFARSGRAQITYGENNRKSVGFAFGDALGQNFAFRISGEYYEKDNDLNYPSYARFDRYDDFATDMYYTIRGKLLWLPTGEDTTRVLFSYARSFDSPTPDDIAGSLWSTGAPSYDEQRGDVWGSILPDYYRSLGLTELPVFQDVRETTVDNFGIEITHDINSNLTFTSMTGYSHSVTDRHSINEGTAGEFLVTDGEFDQELFTQEFRLNYNREGLRWVGGLYFGQEEQSAFRDQTLTSFTQTRNAADIFNAAIFGEIAYEFAPSWTVIAGGRVDYFDQSQDSIVYNNGALTTNTSTTFKDTVFIPKLGIEYALPNSATIALIYQEGYRPGGSGTIAATGAQFDYEAERAKNLELSYRGSALNGQLNFGANLFYQRWDNQQVEVGSYPTNFIANAGESESYGAELELAYAASSRLDVFASVGLLNTEFKDFNVGGTDYSGLDFPGAPGASISLGYFWGDDFGWFSSGSVSYQASSMSRLETGVARPVDLDAYSTVDLSVGYGFENGVRVTGYATNLFDTEYYTYEYGPGAYATLGDRREIGIRVDYTF